MKTKISARKFLSKYMIYLAFVALLIVFSLTLRNVGNGFLDMGNVWNIIRQTALIAILGVGMTYALGAGQISSPACWPVWPSVPSLARSMVRSSHG